MKWMLSIGLSFLCIMAACNSKKQVPEPVEGPTKELSAVDSLMWHQPDSALASILPCFDTCRDAKFCVSTATAYNRHYANLLLSELLYKNDYAQVNRAELLQAVAYFDSLVVDGADTRGVSLQARPRRDAWRASAQNIAFLDARAHYINGVGYYENDSVVQACAEYLKTLEIMESHFEEKELVGHKAQLMAFTYTRLTNLFSDLYLHEQAIYFSKMSLLYYHKHEALIWHIARMLEETASHYEMMGIYDSAFFYYYKGLTSLSDTNDLTYRDISSHLAYLSYKDGKSAEHSLNQLHYLLVHAESSNEFLTRCAIIGEIFFHEKQFDSAVVYLDKVFQNTNNENLKKQDAKLLVEIFKAQGRMSEVLEYAEFITHFATVDEDLGTIKSQLAELYKDFVQNRQDLLHQQEKEKNMKWTAIAVGVLLFVLFMLAFIIITMKRRNTKRMADQNKKHHIEQAAISSRLKRSNQEIRELKDQIRQQQNMAAPKSEQAATFADEPICRLIMERVNKGQFLSQMDCSVYKDYALDKDQLYALRKAADRHFNQFTTRISKAHPELTRGDLDYCCLYLLGLTDADIAALMQRAYNTVNERNSKLRRIFGSENTISITLEAIASESTPI